MNIAVTQNQTLSLSGEIGVGEKPCPLPVGQDLDMVTTTPPPSGGTPTLFPRVHKVTALPTVMAVRPVLEISPQRGAFCFQTCLGALRGLC